jgi:hypothetical protein
MRILAALFVTFFASTTVAKEWSMHMTATVVPSNTIAIVIINDILIADADIFGRQHHKAFVAIPVVTFMDTGIELHDKALAQK